MAGSSCSLAITCAKAFCSPRITGGSHSLVHSLPPEPADSAPAVVNASFDQSPVPDRAVSERAGSRLKPFRPVYFGRRAAILRDTVRLIA